MRQKKQQRPLVDNDILIKEIEDEMLNMFDALTPVEGREIVKKAGILITHNLIIVDAISFDSIMKEMRVKRPNIPGIEHAIMGRYYSKDLGALEPQNFSNIGEEEVGGSSARSNIVIKRVQEAKMLDATNNLQEQVSYMHDISLHKEKAYEDLQEKYRHVFATYEQRTKETLDLQAKVMRLEKKIIELEASRPKIIGKAQGYNLIQLPDGAHCHTVFRVNCLKLHHKRIRPRKSYRKRSKTSRKREQRTEIDMKLPKRQLSRQPS